jgi:predicted RNase H-like nuclease (RuvC/YqgF family)
VTSQRSPENAASPGGTDAPAELPQTREQVQARREDLRAALVDLEDALSGPVGDREHWAERVHGTIEHMHRTLQQHVRDTEAEGGMLAQLEEDAPWLQGRVEQLRREHDELLERTDDLLSRCRGDADLEDVRERSLALLQTVSRHRHQGTDLLYDAYMVDISAAD